MARRKPAATKTDRASVPELIVRKRSGGELTDLEIASLVRGFTSGEVPDYQISALAMAIFFRGMSPREIASLTLAMRDSGRTVDLSRLSGAKIDKHSTGGVGDKVSICLAPMVAACGVRVPMISGRGLGHTGGTLDKLEAIAGFRVDLSIERFVRQVAKLGCALIGQTAELAPADKKLYALRDVTGTVESIPLITASILSKKLAAGIDGLVLDVKVGRGAFMRTRDDARALARSIVRVGQLAGKRVSAVLTTMDEPLGKAVGNALEAAEAFEVLHDRGPDDLIECTLALGTEMLRLARVERSRASAERRLKLTLRSGAALVRMQDIVRAQGGDPRAVSEPDRLPHARYRLPVIATASGFVASLDALEIGLASVRLGAGRARTDDRVDPAVGFILQKKLGDRVTRGEALAEVHASSREAGASAVARLAQIVGIQTRRPTAQPLILEWIRAGTRGSR